MKKYLLILAAALLCAQARAQIRTDGVNSDPSGGSADAEETLSNKTLSAPVVEGTTTYQNSGVTIFSIDPATLDPDAGSFFFTQKTFPNTSESRNNYAVSLGYNYSTGAAIDNSDAGVGLTMESFYENPSSDLLYEFYIEGVSEQGAPNRFFGFQGGRDEGADTYVGSFYVDALNILTPTRSGGGGDQKSYL